MKLLSTLLFVLISTTATANFQVDFGFNYFSDEDDVSNFSYSKLDYRGFLAASLGKTGQLVFGQFISQYGREFSNGGVTGTFSVLELGPKFQYYFTGEKTIYMGLNWNPYVKGSKTVSGTTTDISGSSYIINLGYHLKISRVFNLGASINYHTVSISKETDSTTNVESDISKSYSAIYPMIEMSFRFR